MKKYIITAIGAGSLMMGLSACGSSADKQNSTDITDSIKPTQVRTDVALTQDITLSEELTTTLEAKVKNNISAQAGGRLAQLLVAVGDRVQKGQVVARLEATQLTTAQIQLNDAKTNYQRMDDLYKAGGISKAQWEQARSTMQVAEEQVRNLATNTALRSPISGIVTAKNYDNGDLTSPTLPIVVIEQISPLKATIQVPESYYSFLKAGLPASLSVDALGSIPFEGKISKVFPTIDAKTHTITAEVEFPNKDSRLRPGMYGRIMLNLGSRPAIVVSDIAVQRTVGAGTRYVYVVRDGKAEYRVVEIGRKDGDKQEITKGLQAGEKVVTYGANALKNGSFVKE